MSRGFVYILTNPSMPGLVKIGKTIRSVEGRAHELYQTGVPSPFKVEYYVQAPDCHELELTVHRRLSGKRASDAREFFALPVDEAKEVINEEHRCQIDDWLSEFLPDHSIVESDAFVDPSTIYLLSNRINDHPLIVADMLEYLRPEDMEYAKLKRDARISARKAHVPNDAGTIQ